jgi:hypothetical protein
MKFDLGANFIHGTDGNPLTDIAKKVGSTFVDSIYLRRFYDRDGEALSEEATALINRKIWEYSDAASDYSRENDVDKNESVEDFCKERLEEDQEVKGNTMKELVDSAMKMLAVIAACDLDKLSLKYFWMEDDLPVYPCPEPPEEILGRQTVSRFDVQSNCTVHRSSCIITESYSLQHSNILNQCQFRGRKLNYANIDNR